MTTNSAGCPVCGEGHLSRRTTIEQFDYKQSTLYADDVFHVCDSCGTEVALNTDIRDGLRARTRARKLFDGYLAATEIREFRQQFSITQELAAMLFGGGKVAFSKYENDDVVQSDSMDALIRLCRANPGNIALLSQEKKVELPRVVLERIGQSLHEMLRDIVLREASESMNSEAITFDLPCANDATFRRFSTRTDTLADIAA